MLFSDLRTAKATQMRADCLDSRPQLSRRDDRLCDCTKAIKNDLSV